MTERASKYYSDIVQAAERILDFTKDISSFSQYQNDLKSKSAVERQLSIIGEAVAQLRKTDPSALQKAQQIVSFRNRLIHAYGTIDDSIVWVIIKNHLPLLLSEAKEKSSK